MNDNRTGETPAERVTPPIPPKADPAAPEVQEKPARIKSPKAKVAKIDKSARKGADGTQNPSESKQRSCPVWVDLVLWCVIIGLCVGGYFGYAALKKVYAPAWEEKSFVYVVEMPAVDIRFIPQIGENWGTAVYISDDPDAKPIGELKVAPEILPPEDPALRNTHRKIRLTIVAGMSKDFKAEYREDMGFSANGVSIYAGMSGTFRISGLTAKGTILSLWEYDEYENRNQTPSLPDTTPISEDTSTTSSGDGK